MPNYRYECSTCDTEFEVWQSIKADALTTHDCGGPVVRVLGPVRTHGIGTHGAKTNEVDSREARWQRDMPAYKRFRDKGYQPPQIDGCDHLEATAQNTMEINSGGRLRIDEERMIEAKVLADDIMAGRA